MSGAAILQTDKDSCAITCTFVEVQTVSGYRFRVVLCAYERYTMSLCMYYRVVVDTLNTTPSQINTGSKKELALESN